MVTLSKKVKDSAAPCLTASSNMVFYERVAENHHCERPGHIRLDTNFTLLCRKQRPGNIPTGVSATDVDDAADTWSAWDVSI